MVTIISGDALKTDCGILCHQVNLDGYMGGGIAWQIARKFPNVEKEYAHYPHKELGQVCFAQADNYVIANCFSQNDSYCTDYIALKSCFEKVLAYMNKNAIESVAFPHHYGCGIAKGNWAKVLSIIEEIFKDKTVKIYHI